MFSAAIKKIFSFKLVVILIFSFIAALGTMPYGFRFAQILENFDYFLFLGVGSFLAVVSLLANMALGSYSLLNVNFKQTVVNSYLLSIGSILSAVPYGFICYFGFKEVFPFFANLLISSTVVIVNIGIAYSAIYNFLLERLKLAHQKIPSVIKFIHQLGLVIGLLVSVSIYVATVHGMDNLLIPIIKNNASAFYIACILGIFSWVPFAALYSRSTQIVSERIYIFVTENFRKITSMTKFQWIILIIATGSGASFSQIAIDFFDPARDIPLFFKNEIVHRFIYSFVIPCAFFSSAAVNYLALQRLFERVTKK